MLTVDKEYSESVEIKKSTFIAYLLPYKFFNKKLEYLKLEYKKARHIVWAYRYLNDFQQIVENSTDDGEPKNSSGRPILKVLQGADLIDSVIFVVRYFGGIKLGIGGLVRAYTDAALKVINTAKFIDLNNLFKSNIKIPYCLISQSEYILSSLNINIIGKEFSNEFVSFIIQGRKDSLEKAILKIDDLIKSKFPKNKF
jgi:uncharacterized YigZ family protein